MTETLHSASTSLFAVVLEAAVDAIIVIAKDGKIVQANSACARLFDYQTSDLLGANISLLMPEPYSSEHDQYLRNYLDSGEPKIIGIGRQVQGRRSTGDPFPISLSVGEAHYEGERLFVGIIHDLTARQALLDTLRQREGELRQMMDSAVVPTGIITVGTRLTAANDALNKFLQEVDGVDLRLGSFLADPELECSLNSSLKALHCQAGEITLRSVQFSLGSTTKTADIYLASYPLSGPAPHRFGTIVQLVDRTAQLEAEAVARTTHDRLAYYQRISTLAAVIAGIAHEVNQPMGAIANYAEAGQILANKEPVPRQELESIFQRIASQTSRANNVIRRLRSLASGAGSTKSSVVPGDILEDAVQLYRPQLRQAGVVTRVNRGHNLSPVRVDRVQLQQVLLNLLENARDAMLETKNPVVTLAAIATPEGLLLSVRDCGTGIAPEIAGRLTDPFFTSKADGMGIGLAVCRTVVENHEGRFWFENNDDGPGTTFFILLPSEQGSTHD